MVGFPHFEVKKSPPKQSFKPGLNSKQLSARLPEKRLDRKPFVQKILY